MTTYSGDEFYDDDVTSGVSQIPHKRSGAEPSGVTPVRAADSPGATSSDGGSPETERAMSNVDSPDRNHLDDLAAAAAFMLELVDQYYGTDHEFDMPEEAQFRYYRAVIDEAIR